MFRYRYSVIRFVPSTSRGELVNLGVIVGSDETGEWAMDVVKDTRRARKIDEREVLPFVKAELERLQYRLPQADDDDYLQRREDTLSEAWLIHHAGDSRNVVQFSRPQPIIAENIELAFQKLWSRFIVEHVPRRRSSVSKSQVTSRYLNLLQHFNPVGRFRQKCILELPGQPPTGIDVAVCGKSLRELTQCWSFQLEDTDKVLNEVKSWAWSIRDLRHLGGTLTHGGEPIHVPREVRMSVVYAEGTEEKSQELQRHSLSVFQDSEINVTCIPYASVATYAKRAAELSND